MKQLRFESFEDIKKKVRSNYGNDGAPDAEAIELVQTVEMVRSKIDNLNANLNDAVDPLLIEGFIYELKALHTKYEFFLKKCKEQGLTVDFY
jgi:predicted nucleic acid-binding OB-fold protein